MATRPTLASFSSPPVPSPDLQRLEMSDRINPGLDGYLYFANLIPSDTRKDYTCNVRFGQHMISMEPVDLKVKQSKFLTNDCCQSSHIQCVHSQRFAIVSCNVALYRCHTISVSKTLVSPLRS